MAAAPTFDLLVKGDFPRAFIVPNVPVGANTARVAMLVASSRSGSAVGFTAAINDIFLLDAAGKQHCLEPEAVFPAAPGSADPPAAGSTLNIWIETPAPAVPVPVGADLRMVATALTELQRELRDIKATLADSASVSVMSPTGHQYETVVNSVIDDRLREDFGL